MSSTPYPRLAAVLAAAVGATSLSVALASSNPPAPRPVAATSALAVADRGATVPFVEQEAETAVTNGAPIGPGRNAGTLAGEASGRRAVQLTGDGKYVEFTLTQPANAIDVRYSVPDFTDAAPLAVYVNGTHERDLTLTSKYAWYYGSYPFTNNPADGKAQHFYDETRALLGTTLPAGAKVRLQTTSASAPTVVDLADFELVGAPIARPAGSVSVVEHGADPTGAADSSSAFEAAIAAARSQGREAWVPAGAFKITRHIIVDQVTVRGAGPWYSVLTGDGVGVYGKWASEGGSRNVRLADFAIIGEVKERNDGDQVNAIGGALSDTVVSNIWMQHTKVGAWLDGPMDNLTITGCRILDQTADGVNFHRGVTNSKVENTFVRNTGDDGLAMWSEIDYNAGNVFQNNTVVIPLLANSIAIYGGRDIAVTDNVVADTLTQGGGIHVANRFAARPVAGTFTLARNTTIRAGVLDPNWQFGVGALWFDGRDSAMTATINVTDTELLDSSYEAIHFIGNGVSNVHFSNVRIDGAGTFALQLQSQGSASFTNVTATNIGFGTPIYNCQGPDAFTITLGTGNSGWYTDTPYCGPWPDPVYGPPPSPSPSSPSPTPTGQPNGNLALNKATSESSHTQVYVSANAVDGDAGTYWESANNSFPQSLTVDLGAARTVGRIVLKLPPDPAWEARTQTLSVSGSGDGSAYSTIVASTGYRFDPATGNTVTITFAQTSQRFLRLTITANTGWPAAQVSEYEVYSP